MAVLAPVIALSPGQAETAPKLGGESGGKPLGARPNRLLRARNRDDRAAGSQIAGSGSIRRSCGEMRPALISAVSDFKRTIVEPVTWAVKPVGRCCRGLRAMYSDPLVRRPAPEGEWQSVEASGRRSASFVSNSTTIFGLPASRHRRGWRSAARFYPQDGSGLRRTG